MSDKKYKKEDCLILLQNEYQELQKEGLSRYPQRSDFEDRHYNLVAVLVLIECMLPFLLVFEGRKPKARELVTIAVLCAIGIAGRGLFFMLPQFKPVLALTIIAGVAFEGGLIFVASTYTGKAFLRFCLKLFRLPNKRRYDLFDQHRLLHKNS